MIGRIVEVADNHRHLSVKRGFLEIRETGQAAGKLGQVPLDDVAALIANAHGISYTNNLLVALAERGCPFVLCAANHNAVGMLLPIDGHHVQARRIDAQIMARAPLNKQLWAAVVKSKLAQQAAALEATGVSGVLVSALIRKVKSGDVDNIEAQGARRYWSRLFGEGFRREQQCTDKNALANSLLNYGYTVLRATTARAVVAAGLHPSIGIHHSNDANAMRLVDDLMEPFRPLVDLRVWQLLQAGYQEVCAHAKKQLALLMYEDMQSSLGATPVMVCTQRLATSLAQVYLKERERLDLPLPGMPLALMPVCSPEDH
ncbi:MAG: type II CRISPR-associated endonuclease Cas1 [Lautropia sp.]|nr:type II CRISPR-associated endonuclease Cas1 [Lautropia sp.]